MPLSHADLGGPPEALDADGSDDAGSAVRVEAARRRGRVNHWKRWENRGVDHYRQNARTEDDPEGTSLDVLK